MELSSLPNKSTYSFNEVCSLTSVKPYVLRFWESEFSQIDPINSNGGSKVYDLTDLMAVLKVRKLLFDEKLSIPKAKQRLIDEGIEMIETLPIERLDEQAQDLSRDLKLAEKQSYAPQLDLQLMKSLLENSLSEIRSLKSMLE